MEDFSRIIKDLSGKIGFKTSAKDNPERNIINTIERDYPLARIIIVRKHCSSVEFESFFTSSRVFTNYECVWNAMIRIRSNLPFNFWVIEEDVDDIFFNLLHFTINSASVIYYGRDVELLKIKVFYQRRINPMITFRNNTNVIDRIRSDMLFYAGHKMTILIVTCGTSDLEEIRRRTKLKVVPCLESDEPIVITTSDYLKHHNPRKLYDVVLDQGLEMVNVKSCYETCEKRRSLTSRGTSDYTMSFASQHYVRYSNKYALPRVDLTQFPFRLSYHLNMYGGVHGYHDYEEGIRELQNFESMEMANFVVNLPFNPRNGKILFRWCSKKLPVFPCFVILTIIENPPRYILRNKILPQLEQLFRRSNLETFLNIVVTCLDDVGGPDAGYLLIREWCCYYSLNADQVWNIIQNLISFNHYFPDHPIATFNTKIAINLFRDIAVEEYKDFLIEQDGESYRDKHGNKYNLEVHQLHIMEKQLIPLNVFSNLILVALNV